MMMMMWCNYKDLRQGLTLNTEFEKQRRKALRPAGGLGQKKGQRKEEGTEKATWGYKGACLLWKTRR